MAVDYGTRPDRLAKRDGRLPDETLIAKAARKRQSCRGKLLDCYCSANQAFERWHIEDYGVASVAIQFRVW